jgi:hypothetical protein
VELSQITGTANWYRWQEEKDARSTKELRSLALHLHHLPEAQYGHVSVALERRMVHLARASQLQGGSGVRCIKGRERAVPLHHPPNSKHCFIDPVVCCNRIQLQVTKLYGFCSILQGVDLLFMLLVHNIVDDRYKKERKCNCVDGILEVYGCIRIWVCDHPLLPEQVLISR